MKTDLLLDDCQSVFEDDPDRLDIDDLQAVRADLTVSVNSRSTHTGLYAESTADRAIAASRIAWLATRVAWLEGVELYAQLRAAEIDA
jgi:hypothetical protein